MTNIMSNENVDIFKAKTNKNDIVEIVLIQKARIKHKETEREYFNDTFLKITNRKGEIRVLDLLANIDITSMLDKLELVYTKNTKIKPIFIEC